MARSRSKWLRLGLAALAVAGAALLVAGITIPGAALLAAAAVVVWYRATVGGLDGLAEDLRGRNVVLPDPTVTPLEAARLEALDRFTGGGGDDN